MQNLKVFIGSVVALTTIGIALFSSIPNSLLIYFSFGIVSAIIIGMIEFGTFKKSASEILLKHGEEYKSHHFILYAPVVLINIVIWGYGLTIHLLSALDMLIANKA